MKDKTKCPKCQQEADHVIWYLEVGGIEEENIECHHCGYWYIYSYGHYSEGVNVELITEVKE